MGNYYKKNGGKRRCISVLQTTCMFAKPLVFVLWSGATRLFIPCHVHANLGTPSTLTLAHGELDLLRSIQYFQLISLFIQMCSLTLTGQPGKHLHFKVNTGIYPNVFPVWYRPARISPLHDPCRGKAGLSRIINHSPDISRCSLCYLPARQEAAYNLSLVQGEQEK